MASNRKLKYRAGELLKAKYNTQVEKKYILILEALWDSGDELKTAYHIMDLETGIKSDAYRRTVELYYAPAK